MAYAPESPLSPRRLAAIAAVVALHVGMLYALKNGLAHHVSELITGPLETKMIEEAPPEEKEPPPPPPKLEQPPPFVPPPDIAIDMPVETTTNTITVQSTAPVVAPPKPAAPVVKTPPRGDPRRPLSQPDYPPTARRLGQEGTVILLIYVLQDGKVGEVKIQKSSGFPKLDEAAAAHAQRNWRFIPGKEGNTPVASWGQFAVTFKLIDE